MATSVSDIGRKLRTLLVEPRSGDLSLDVALGALGALAADLATGDDDTGRRALATELWAVHADVLAKSADARAAALWLAVMQRASPALPAASIIGDWWEGVLRPALRAAAPGPAAHAKAVVLAALHSPGAQYSRPVTDFRRRLLDLYLRDAPGDDLLELAAMSAPERAAGEAWHASLQDILVQHGAARPADLLDEVADDYARTPRHRRPLLALLTTLAESPGFAADGAPRLAAHPLAGTLLASLQLDGDGVVLTAGVALLVRLLPMFAQHAPGALRALVPRLMRVLARLVCFTGPAPDDATADDVLASSSPVDSSVDMDVTGSPQAALYAAPVPLPGDAELAWRPLEHPSDTPPAVPDVRRLFTFLYYLFPCNIIRFLRGPVAYLVAHKIPTPYSRSWADALDEAQIKSRTEPFLRAHVMHPRLVWEDADQELSADSDERWAKLEIEQIVGEASMLDVRAAGLVARQLEAPIPPGPPRELSASPDVEILSEADHDDASHAAEDEPEPEPGTTPRARGSEMLMITPRVSTRNLAPVLEDREPPEREVAPVVSVPTIVATALLLRSGADVTLVGPTWTSLGAAVTPSEVSDVVPSTPPVGTPAHSRAASHERTPPPPRSALENMLALAGRLQREVAALQTELALELWLNRENVKHVARLHDNHVLTRNADVERQALHNRLRFYKQTNAKLEHDAASHRQAAALTHEKAQKWSLDLQSKLQVRRDEIRKWDSQTAVLRAETVDLKAKLEAQGHLLEDANAQVFKLQAQIKETAHKVDRLRDYESRIAQLTTTQQLWDDDVQKLSDQKEAMAVLVSECQKLRLRVESHEQNEARLLREIRQAHEHVQVLQAEGGLGRRPQTPKVNLTADFAAAATARAKLDQANTALRQRVEAMQEEMDELRQELEDARATASVGAT